MLSLSTAGRISAFIGMIICSSSLYAQVTCIKSYLDDPDRTSLGFAPSDVEVLVSNVAKSIGLSPSGIRIIPCDGVANAQSIYLSRPDIPIGDYILYDPVWVRQVIGNDIGGVANSKSHDEAIFLFGHELGHLILRHYTSNASLPRIRKEMDADHFGGCAAGAMRAKWENIADFIGRIRGDFDTTYPSRANSLVTAKEGFDVCMRPLVPPPPPPPAPERKEIKVCMGNGGGASCADGADVVYNCDTYRGIGGGGQKTVNILAERFCSYTVDGKTTISPSKVIVTYNTDGGQCGWTRFNVICNP